MPINGTRTALLVTRKTRYNIEVMTLGFTGHQKMPDSVFAYTADAIDNYIKLNKDVIGICNLAAGSDQLFASKIIESGNKLIAIIPCRNYESTFDSKNLATYKKLLNKADETIELDFDNPTEEAFYAAGKAVAKRCDKLIAVWDGEPSKGLGGTADVVSYAQSLGKEVIKIWPEGVQR